VRVAAEDDHRAAVQVTYDRARAHSCMDNRSNGRSHHPRRRLSAPRNAARELRERRTTCRAKEESLKGSRTGLVVRIVYSRKPLALASPPRAFAMTRATISRFQGDLVLFLIPKRVREAFIMSKNRQKPIFHHKLFSMAPESWEMQVSLYVILNNNTPTWCSQNPHLANY
jgi:hypothetical protein